MEVVKNSVWDIHGFEKPRNDVLSRYMDKKEIVFLESIFGMLICVFSNPIRHRRKRQMLVFNPSMQISGSRITVGISSCQEGAKNYNPCLNLKVQ